jgi:hypothetical protein
VNGVYSLIHIILMFFIRSGNHKFYIQFSRLLRLQSFRITLYIYKASTYLPLILSKQEMSLSQSQVAVHSVFVVLFGYLLHGRNRHRQHLATPSQHKTAAICKQLNSNANLSENRHSLVLGVREP